MNGSLPSDETRELITIVILDENDQLPRFNQAIFYLNVSETISEAYIPDMIVFHFTLLDIGL